MVSQEQKFFESLNEAIESAFVQQSQEESAEETPVRIEEVPRGAQDEAKTHRTEPNILEDYLAAQETTDQVPEAQTADALRAEPRASGSDSFSRAPLVQNEKDESNEQETVVHVI